MLCLHVVQYAFVCIAYHTMLWAFTHVVFTCRTAHFCVHCLSYDDVSHYCCVFMSPERLECLAFSRVKCFIVNHLINPWHSHVIVSRIAETMFSWGDRPLLSEPCGINQYWPGNEDYIYMVRISVTNVSFQYRYIEQI